MNVRAGLLALLVVPLAAANPFAPLTAREIRATTRMIRAYGRVSPRAQFTFMALAEPPKATVLRGESSPRRSFSVVYDPATNRTWEFDQPFFIILNVAVGGQWPGAPDSTTTFPQTMKVDYVRVYAASP